MEYITTDIKNNCYHRPYIKTAEYQPHSKSFIYNHLERYDVNDVFNHMPWRPRCALTTP
jgi:hypothetical protein